MSNKSIWTAKYAFLNAAYYAGFCTIHAYAAVYLLANGFTNTEVGILLALANVLSAFAQPFFAALIDRPGRLTNRMFTMISIASIMALTVVLFAAPGHKIFIFVIYMLIYTIQFTYQPVVTALCFEYQKAGCDIFYGLARGLGSACFAVTSAFIGGLTEKHGVTVLLIADLVIMLLSFISIIIFRKPEANEAYNKDSASAGVSPDAVRDLTGAEDSTGDAAGNGMKAHNNIIEFSRIYPAFMFLLGATVCFFFAHNMINDFLIQIIRSLGGAETQMGYATFLAALLELPVMAIITILIKKISPDSLLIVSGCAFFVKTLILIFAASMLALYVSQSFQMLAYAVFVPASAYYVSQNMEELDQVKGQAFVSSAITIGGVFSNLICGRILDVFGIKPMLITGTAVCFAGVVTAVIAVRKIPKYVPDTEKTTA